MSNPSGIDERLRAVENAITAHVSECRIRNEENADWKKGITEDVQSLKIERAKVAGYLLGLAAVGGAVGSGGAQAIFKFFGG